MEASDQGVSLTISLNHTIVAAKDRQHSAYFLTWLLGLPDPVPAGHFLAVRLENGVTLDYAEPPDGVVPAQHYAFLVSEEDFDAIYGRIGEIGLEHWADPRQSAHGINRNDGGRGTYFLDPSGHFLEIITRPYGSGG
ncbi:VOC family protein [Rhodococcus sp. NPDC058505]|uniref:VOC family protein n=1 Tax=unclassified Rhodococcus (in: high G+C Gram-positive bacteria) TaxID=192944 RepID=UPI00364D4FDC